MLFSGEEKYSSSGASSSAVLTAKLPVKEQFEMMKAAVRVAVRRPGGLAHLAQVLPILRVMTGPQRLAFASFLAKQISAPPNGDDPPLKVAHPLPVSHCIFPIRCPQALPNPT